MQKAIKLRLSEIMVEAKECLLQLSTKQKTALEKSWDIEHAFYSSVLEGCELDRRGFEKLGERIA